LPLLVFLCGGGMEEMDWNVWQGEMSWFAKKGWAVACVEYSTNPRIQWPDQLKEVKTAIRFLRAHASELRLKTDTIIIAGESAGGYLSLATALSNEKAEYETEEFADCSSAVQGVIPWYPVVSCLNTAVKIHVDTSKMPNLLEWVTPSAPPALLLHGTADQLVPHSESEQMYDALIKAGVACDLYLIEQAHHNDAPFVQLPVKQLMLDFMNKHTK
ncbi:MAG: alpha/beta hydrolase, partial [Gemmiger sp.]